MVIKNSICLILLIFSFLSAVNTKTFAIEDDDLFKSVEIKDGVSLSVSDCSCGGF